MRLGQVEVRPSVPSSDDDDEEDRHRNDRGSAAMLTSTRLYFPISALSLLNYGHPEAVADGLCAASVPVMLGRDRGLFD
jgi:hypothetical protein